MTIVETLAGMAPLLRTNPISLEMLTTEHVIPMRLRTNSRRPSLQMEKETIARSEFFTPHVSLCFCIFVFGESQLKGFSFAFVWRVGESRMAKRRILASIYF